MGRIRSEPTSPISVRVPLQFKEECERKAEAEDISFNEWIRRAMQDRFLDNRSELNNLLSAAELRINQLKVENEHYRSEIVALKNTLETITKENTQLSIDLALLKADEIPENIVTLELVQLALKEVSEKTDSSILQLSREIEAIRKEIEQLKAARK